MPCPIDRGRETALPCPLYLGRVPTIDRGRETALPCPLYLGHVPTIDRGRETALPCPLYHSGCAGIDINLPKQSTINDCGASTQARPTDARLIANNQLPPRTQES